MYLFVTRTWAELCSSGKLLAVLLALFRASLFSDCHSAGVLPFHSTAPSDAAQQKEAKFPIRNNRGTQGK